MEDPAVVIVQILAAARDGDIHAALSNRLECLTDSDGARRAGDAVGHVRTLDGVLETDVSGHRVRHQHRNDERIEAASLVQSLLHRCDRIAGLPVLGQTLAKLLELRLLPGQDLDGEIVQEAAGATHAGAHVNPHAMRIHADDPRCVRALVDELDLEARVGHGLARGVARYQRDRIILGDLDAGESHRVRVDGVQRRPDGGVQLGVLAPMLGNR